LVSVSIVIQLFLMILDTIVLDACRDCIEGVFWRRVSLQNFHHRGKHLCIVEGFS
jgi:hypothetical protein